MPKASHCFLLIGAVTALGTCAQPTLNPPPSPTPTVAGPTPSASPEAETPSPSTPQPLAPGVSASGFPPQTDGVPFPTEAWPEGAWPAGVHRGMVDEAVDEAFADGGFARVRAVVIIHRGHLVYERYSPNAADGRSKIMPSFSIAKSFTSALVGILVRDGRLDVDVPAEVAEWSGPGDPRGAITVDDLLRMSSGLSWTQGSYPNSPDPLGMMASDDAAAYVAAKPLVDEPGSTFLYSDGNTVVIDRVVADLVGSGHAFREFMRLELLDRIGINRLDMDFDNAGTWLGAWSADTTARNFAKLGLLYLRDGVWDGERILPEGWVDYCRTPSATNPEYGAGWWLDNLRPGVFYAIGVRGQVIAVDPAHDLTFVTLATDSQASLPVGEAILDAFDAGT
jgi:CubicO group peptidase (beta-lactamase class C family)